MRPSLLIPAAMATFLLLADHLVAHNCQWEFKKQKKVYSFVLDSMLHGYPHGILSEDGFYKVSQDDTDDASVTHTFWFQLCESMKFNHGRPQCFKCETCGGPLHCGETCSALHATTFSDLSICETLGFAANTSFSAIDAENPEQGLIVTMSAATEKKQCSLSVSIQCGKKVELSVVNHEASTKCSFSTVLKHPAGCPVVASGKHKGLGWFSILLIFLVCGFAIYMIGGITYRRQVLGVSGCEAVPNLEFWISVPSLIQSGVGQCCGSIRGLFRRFTEPSYMQVD